MECGTLISNGTSVEVRVWKFDILWHFCRVVECGTLIPDCTSVECGTLISDRTSVEF